MADGRMLKKAISKSRKLSKLSGERPMLLYTWLLPHLDIEGRFSGDPLIIKGSVFPRVIFITPELIETDLVELAAHGLILLYEANGDKFLQFTKFKEHQYLRPEREKKSEIPPPPFNSDQSPEPPRSPPAQDKLREVKLNQDKLSQDNKQNPRTRAGCKTNTKPKLKKPCQHCGEKEATDQHARSMRWLCDQCRSR